MLDFRRLSWSWLGSGGSASDSAGEVARPSVDPLTGESRIGMSNDVRDRSLGGTVGGRLEGGEEGSDEGGEERDVSTVARDAGRRDDDDARLDCSSSTGVVSPSDGGGLGGGPPILDGPPVPSMEADELATSSADPSPAEPDPPNAPLTAAPILLTPSSTGFEVGPGPGRMTIPLFGETLWMWTSVGGGCDGGDRARSPLAGGRTAAY